MAKIEKEELNYKEEIEPLLRSKPDTLQDFREFIEKFEYEDILRDRTDADVRQEFNDVYKMLVRLYQCDFAVPSWGDMIHIVNLKLIK
jgi:hypothetical protein